MKTEEKEWSDNFVEVLAAHSSLTGYLPRYGNQAIKFTGDDMGGDKAMVEVLLYILIAIMAFIFAVTTNNTIVKEASVIGRCAHPAIRDGNFCCIICPCRY